jgi:RIO-like serine/threonine protein kinase
VVSTGLLDYILYYASTGAITVHTEIDYSEIQISGQIGLGASAIVYKGVYKGKEVAVKEFK